MRNTEKEDGGDGEDEEGLPEAAEDEEASSTKKKGGKEKSHMYTSMYYKKNNSTGVREKFGAKKQIMRFGGNMCGKTKVRLRKIADTIQEMLDDGAGKAICVAEAKRLVAA